MTKKLFISLILTFTLLILSNEESNGQCPSGYSSKVVTIPVGPCDYKVEVCYKCEIHHPGTIKINRIEIVDTSCYSGLNIIQILLQIYTEISTGGFIYSNFCIDSWYDAPPCTEPLNESAYSQFIISYSYCWQVRHRHNGIEPIFELIPCEENASCTETIRYCFNGSDYIKIGSTFSNPQNPPCSLQFHQITWPSQLDESSECFILNTVPCGIVSP